MYLDSPESCRMLQMNGEKHKERVKQQNVKITAGSENFQRGHRKSFTC